MYRLIELELVSWKEKAERLPLIVRGARQVGKSYVIEAFGKKYFENVVVIDFELTPSLKAAFSDLDPEKIIQMLGYSTGQQILAGKTLLFLDEIQECVDAIQALRYFKERMPGLHVIAAGSLLEFTLRDANFSMPVGRVQYVYLKPLSFKEFLVVLGHENLKNLIETTSWDNPVPEFLHQQLLELVRLYFILGGMPAVISEYIQSKNLTACRRLQIAMLSTYRSDFGKYSNVAKHKYLEALFVKAPRLVAQQFQYVDVSREMQARDIKQAILDLGKAGLLHQVFMSSGAGLPLNTLINEKQFKLLFLDIGLVYSTMNLDPDLLMKEDLLLVNRGAFSEQFVGQELLASVDPYQEAELYFWCRDKKGSQAEIDYLMQIGLDIVPVEVKSGSTGSLKSIKIFMQERNMPRGIRISAVSMSKADAIISIPFYLISEISRLWRAC